MEKKIALSIEQMKYLEELGFDTSDASIYWRKMTMNARGKTDELEEPFLSFSNKQGLTIGMVRIEIIPAYTLQDILEKLPNSIYGKDLTSDIYEVMGWVLQKSMSMKDKYKIVYCQNSIEEDYVQLNPTIKDYSLLGTAYQMLCWCIENNYIKTNKG